MASDDDDDDGDKQTLVASRAQLDEALEKRRSRPKLDFGDTEVLADSAAAPVADDEAATRIDAGRALFSEEESQRWLTDLRRPSSPGPEPLPAAGQPAGQLAISAPAAPPHAALTNSKPLPNSPTAPNAGATVLYRRPEPEAGLPPVVGSVLMLCGILSAAGTMALVYLKLKGFW